MSWGFGAEVTDILQGGGWYLLVSPAGVPAGWGGDWKQGSTHGWDRPGEPENVGLIDGWLGRRIVSVWVS